MGTSLREPLFAVLIGAAAGGCQLPSWMPGGGADEPGPTADDIEVPGMGMVSPAADLGVPARPPGPLARARRKLRYVTKDARHLGFNLRTLSEIYALAGAVEVPDWSDPGDGDPLDTRDDDLTTGWRCSPSRESTCAFGIHFPEPATVTAVRLWASGRTAEGARTHPRLHEIRVHTDEGYGDVIFADDDEFAFAIFGRPVETRQLTVEIVAVHEGEKSGVVSLGDLEVYGSAGLAREPLHIDPALAVVRPEGEPWRKSGMTHKLEGSFVELVRPDGTLRRFAPGSALYGSAGDRIVLLEQMLQTVCTVQQGRYFLIDLHTRVWMPVGDLGGLPGAVFRHQGGEGFAVGYVDEDISRLQGVFREPEKYVRRETTRMDRTPYRETFADWRVAEGALPRGGSPLSEPIEGCRAATEASLAPLAKARGSKPATPSRWIECDLGPDHTAFVTSAGDCGSAWEIQVVSDSGRAVAHRRGSAKAPGARVRVRSTSELGLLVEVGEGSAAHTFVVRSDGIVSLPEGTVLAARPPRACKKGCDDGFPNPRAPS